MNTFTELVLIGVNNFVFFYVATNTRYLFVSETKFQI